MTSCMLTQKDCQHDCEYGPDSPCKLMKRFTAILRKLTSDLDADVISAVVGMRRVLTAENLDFHDVAAAIEWRRYNVEDMVHALNRGKELARREVGDRQQPAALEFFDGDEPHWYNMAEFCSNNAESPRLTNWEKTFAGNIVGKTITDRMKPHVLGIYIKLGGRCDPKIRARYPRNFN